MRQPENWTHCTHQRMGRDDLGERDTCCGHTEKRKGPYALHRLAKCLQTRWGGTWIKTLVLWDNASVQCKDMSLTLV